MLLPHHTFICLELQYPPLWTSVGPNWFLICAAPRVFKENFTRITTIRSSFVCQTYLSFNCPLSYCFPLKTEKRTFETILSWFYPCVTIKINFRCTMFSRNKVLNCCQETDEVADSTPIATGRPLVALWCIINLTSSGICHRNESNNLVVADWLCRQRLAVYLPDVHVTSARLWEIFYLHYIAPVTNEAWNQTNKPWVSIAFLRFEMFDKGRKKGNI